MRLEDIRTIATALPEVVEKPHVGRPAFRVRDKLFAGLRVDLSTIDPKRCQELIQQAWSNQAPSALRHDTSRRAEGSQATVAGPHPDQFSRVSCQPSSGSSSSARSMSAA